MSYGERLSQRVAFSNPLTVHIMSIDGTWRRTCKMLDISSTGALLLVEGSLQGLQLKEFFLLLSSRGLVYRRCYMVRMNGDEMGISFLSEQRKSKKSIRASPEFGLSASAFGAAAKMIVSACSERVQSGAQPDEGALLQDDAQTV